MNLIDRYVTEVGKHLPRKTHIDIEAELRSTLEDMLDDRSQQTGRPADETLSSELLQEFGAPRKVAETYQTHPYLIGPRMFPIYTRVLKIVFFAVILGLSIATVASLIGSNMAPPEILGALGKFVASLANALMIAIGNVTLIFAILERTLPSSEFKDTGEWTPADLTQEPDPRQVKVGEMITSIVFTLAGLIILNFYPKILGVWNLENGEWRQIISLSDAFFNYLPWINLAGFLTIVLNIILLRKGTWNEITRWAHLGINFFEIGIAVALLRNADLLIVSSSAISLKVGFPLSNMFNWMIPIALLIVIIVNIIEIVKDILIIFRQNKGIFPLEKGF
jgi:hypothetical protein